MYKESPFKYSKKLIELLQSKMLNIKNLIFHPFDILHNKFPKGKAITIIFKDGTKKDFNSYKDAYEYIIKNNKKEEIDGIRVQ